MPKAKAGDTVKVHYTGKLATGEVFDSSREREPLEFTLGNQQMIKGFDAAATGMEIGETKTVTLSPAEAYGEVDQNMFFPISRTDIPAEIRLEIGLQLNAQTNTGQPIQVSVAEIHDDKIIVDANHPLAGKDLIFEIQMLEIISPGDADKKPLLYD